MTTPSMTMALRIDGNPPKMWFAKVSHIFENGHHIFTSKSIPGLLIAEKDAKKAFSQIVPTIQALVWHSTKQKVQVFLGADFKEFEREHCSVQNIPAVTQVGIIKVAA